MKQMTPEKLAMSEMLNARPEVRDFMKVAMTLPQEQLQFITGVMTICKDKDIRPDDAWNMVCRAYSIPTTQELDMIYQKRHNKKTTPAVGKA